jgi:hypothetical protein
LSQISDDNKALLAEIKILFPGVDNISMSNTFNESTDSTKTVPVLIYKSTKGLPENSVEKNCLSGYKRLVKEMMLKYRPAYQSGQ